MLIEEILINGMLKDFYESYREHGKGIITNHIAGEKLYNLLGQDKIDSEIDKETKNDIWKKCGKSYNIYYSAFKEYSNEAQKKLAHRYYKSALIEHLLNKLLKEDGTGQIITLGTITDIYFKDTGEEKKLTLKKMNNKLGMAIFDLSTED